MKTGTEKEGQKTHQGREGRKEEAEEGGGGWRERAEANHNWPDSGSRCGAVAGWNMCVFGGWSGGEGLGG